MTIASGQTATAADVLSAFVAKTGDVMRGPLTLAASPVLPMQAATKQYVDAAQSDISSIKSFGAKLDGTDDSPAIQAAVNAAIERGGGEVILPSGANIGIASTINIESSNIRLVGSGSGGGWHDSGTPFAGGATVVRWLGASDGTMVSIRPAAGATQGLRGCGVSGIYFDPGAGCGTAVSIISNMAGLIDIAGHEFSNALLSMGCSTTLAEAADCQQNDITLYGINVSNAGSVLVINGTAAANPSLNAFRMIKGDYLNGSMLNLKNCDNNVFYCIQGFRVPGGAGYGIELYGHASDAGQACRNNMFLEVSPGAGGVYAHGTEAQAIPSGPNTIHAYDQGNGPPAPIVGNGAVLYWAGNNNPIGKRQWSVSPSASRMTSVDSSGYIRQSGETGVIAANGSLSVTLPIPLTSAATLVSVTPVNSPGPFAAVANTTTLTISNGAAANSYYWLVEGY